MIRELQLVQNDTRPWQFTLKDETGAAVDLTSTTVIFSMRLRGATTNKIDGVGGTITSAAAGVVKYLPTGSNVDTPGTYDLELKLTDSTSKIQHNYDLIPVSIREALK